MKAAVIGAGSWGTALAQVLAQNYSSVSIWARREGVASDINDNHVNSAYLPNCELSKNLFATTSVSSVLDDAEFALLVTPSAYTRQTAESIKPYISADVPILICSKGLEADTGALLGDVVADVLGERSKIAVLSGPTHAEEVVRLMPAAAVVASKDEDCARQFVRALRTPSFRTYGSSDIVGVELCGAFKNVIAIAVGIAYGFGYGDNTAAMLITRGLAEQARMVSACGGLAITCMGLAGAGDMVVTCMSQHSRNRRFGENYVARGLGLEEFYDDTHMVVEGALACKNLAVLAQKYNVDLPLTDAVRQIVWEGGDPLELRDTLISRPAKPEFYDM